jgi:hypothetical protein
MRRSLLIVTPVVITLLAALAWRGRPAPRRGPEPLPLVPVQPDVPGSAAAPPRPPLPVTWWRVDLAVPSAGFQQPDRERAVEIRPGWFQLPKPRPCTAAGSRVHVEAVGVVRAPGLEEDDLRIRVSFFNADRVPCEVRWEARTNGVRNGNERGGSPVRPGETATFAHHFPLGKAIRRVEIAVEPGRGGPPPLAVDLDTGAVERGSGAFQPTPPPPPLDAFADLDSPAELTYRRLPVDLRLPGISQEIPGFRADPAAPKGGVRLCTRIEDLAVSDLYLAEEQGRPGAPTWVMVDAAFLKRGPTVTASCTRFSQGYAALLGSDARHARAQVETPRPGASALARWPVAAGTRQVRLGFGDEGPPLAVLEVDLEKATARLVQPSPPPRPGRSEVDLAGEWSEREGDPDGYAVTRALHALAILPPRKERLAAFCAEGRAAGPETARTMFQYPRRALHTRLCAQPKAPEAPAAPEPPQAPAD